MRLFFQHFQQYSFVERLKFPKMSEIVLYQDEHLLALNKPAGMPSLKDRNNPEQTDLLAHIRRLHPEAQLCHRLDKATSGVLLAALNPETYRKIALQFQEREIKKQYYTLVAGRHLLKNVQVDAPVSLQRNGLVRIDPIHGKSATTIFNSVEYFSDYTLLCCEPVTGRQHQIRVHLAYLQCPIIGDKDYGGKDVFLSKLKKKYHLDKNSEKEQPINHHFLLHAGAITFKHPKNENLLTCQAPFPKHFEAVLKTLRKYNCLPAAHHPDPV